MSGTNRLPHKIMRTDNHLAELEAPKPLFAFAVVHTELLSNLIS